QQLYVVCQCSANLNKRGVYVIELAGNIYEIIENKKGGLHEEVLKERYSDILKKYDYIVGDWGYEQLRLKGFYKDNNPKATFDKKINVLEDYLYEYCNFGCAYFVIKKVN